jgi:small subunit ribosomal protein S20
MANIKSAKKRIRVIEAKTHRNRRVKSHLKETLKGFESALAHGEQKTARDLLAIAERKLMQAAAKGTIHKNAASRKVARLTAAFTKAFGAAALLEKAERPVYAKIEEEATPVAQKPALIVEKAEAPIAAAKEAADEIEAEVTDEPDAEAGDPSPEAADVAAAEEAEEEKAE